MKKIILSAVMAITLLGCGPAKVKNATQDHISATLDLVNLQDDKVKAVVNPGKISSETINFYIPKTVPGTYSTDNYGQFIEGFKAIDYDGNELTFKMIDDNTFEISNATELDLVEYWVNDSYDIAGEEGVFSPAGTNIEAGKNFMLNLHGFVGYFEGMTEQPYQLEITRPNTLVAGTSLTAHPASEPVGNNTKDIFKAKRYFEITDNPIMYAKPDVEKFVLGNMTVELHVYSPNGTYSAAALRPNMEKILNAQKAFLGDIDNTNTYVILLYLADMSKTDAKGFGALEHHTSTTVVLPETMPLEALNETMKDVVSHEFFHIITPLNVHSEEVHYFNYNDPKMSKHLWMYEGVTEYFANLFQVNQGLIDNEAFYARMEEKISSSKSFDDTMSFTVMSENILDEKYEKSYYNVYLKGALIGMALDIRLRELSNGEMGILDLMKKLSDKYGKEKPFEDDQIVNDIVALTYPEIRSFFDTHVIGTTPIPYDEFFEKVGVEKSQKEETTDYFLHGQMPFIDANPDTKEVFIREGIALNSFMEKIGLQGGDVIQSINGTEYNLDNIFLLITSSRNWKEGDDIEIKVKRDDKEVTLKGKVSTPTTTVTTLKDKDLPATDKRVKLREAWLKG
ncbi:peptidase M61 [Mesonia sp. K7]|uniref:M61 family metallopeptidase n=1 Tax=Mesonia sp. K7 TaxID=2218606 RepID=UPI000DA86FF6|nr:peptidase M61 [Mesonia sp. K7]PZD79570.1 peptidase M61 [Mesonia sp. K7]